VPIVRSDRRNITANAQELPHIVNLNEDMLLSGRIKHRLPEGKLLRIGRAPLEEEADMSDSSSSDHTSYFTNDLHPDIIVSGVNIFANHATIKNEGHRCVLHSRGEAARHTFVRGVKCSTLLQGARKEARKSLAVHKHVLQRCLSSAVVTLHHGDVIAFGHSLFFFVDPTISPAEVLILSNQVSWSAARKELARHRWDIPRKQIKRIAAMKDQPPVLTSSVSGLLVNDIIDSPLGSDWEEMEEQLAVKVAELQERDTLLAESNGEKDQLKRLLAECNGEKDELKRLLEEARCELAAKETELQEARMGQVGTALGSRGAAQQPVGDCFPRDLGSEVAATFDEVFRSIEQVEQHFAKR